MDGGSSSSSTCSFPTATDILARLPPKVRRRLRLVCRLWRAVVDRLIRGTMDEGGSFPTSTDVLADILARLPPNDRRRLRLVCRLWRAVIDKRTTTDMRGHGKILVVTTDGIAYVLSPGHPAAPLWPRDHAKFIPPIKIVGTCNGIVCWCDNGKPGGAITLANPSIGDVLHLPPLPASAAAIPHLRGRCRGRSGWNSHPMTRQYKVVHVFTLGEASWREVHAGPNARCVLGACHLAEVDGMVYWMTWNTGRVAAFDLEDESVTLTEPLPAGTEPIDYWLTKVHARLGAVVGGGESATVWVLEGTRWNCSFMVKEQLRWNITMPHFARGDYVLTHAGSNKFIDRHKMSEAARWQGGVAQIRRSDHRQGAVVEAVLSLGSGIQQTFVYAETKEPLSVYRTDGIVG